MAPTSNQLVPPSVEYCHRPSDAALAAFWTTATALIVSAGWSGSEKPPKKSEATVAPGGAAISSGTAASVALMTLGSSLIGVTLVPIVAGDAEIAVAAP